ncbi:hypothetical protein M9H77_12189 [Catharanthus roseus]|uniref:Uncharacterized protein n=1 Tax=Catharanthus roseus TaxID=4058 RepID=A0ACC0BGN0_CATRO|nr:hypothetical protein M9H77_12189 [Catharanthus roseus]
MWFVRRLEEEDLGLFSSVFLQFLCLYNELRLCFLSPNPNVLSVFHVYEDENFLHIVLELCNSSYLFQRLTSKPVFPEPEAIFVMRRLNFGDGAGRELAVNKIPMRQVFYRGMMEREEEEQYRHNLAAAGRGRRRGSGRGEPWMMEKREG